MSLAVGAVSSYKNMGGFDENKEGGGGGGEKSGFQDSGDESECAIDQEEEEDATIQLGPQYNLKEQLEKDKDDESLRRWKEQLLGSVDINNVGDGKPKGLWFTLKEGSPYSLRFSFQVSNNIVFGFRSTNNVWKTGVRVDSTKEMLRTFSPQQEPYTFDVPEETTPSGYFARGQYSAKSKFIDDDNKCYLEIHYTFDIRRDWAKP